jgi:hypothetical protein
MNLFKLGNNQLRFFFFCSLPNFICSIKTICFQETHFGHIVFGEAKIEYLNFRLQT